MKLSRGFMFSSEWQSVKTENIMSPDSPVRSSAGSSSSSSWVLWRKSAVLWFISCVFFSTAGHCDQLSPKLKERVKICSSPDSLFLPLTSPKPVRPADTPSLSPSSFSMELRLFHNTWTPPNSPVCFCVTPRQLQMYNPKNGNKWGL